MQLASTLYKVDRLCLIIKGKKSFNPGSARFSEGISGLLSQNDDNPYIPPVNSGKLAKCNFRVWFFHGVAVATIFLIPITLWRYRSDITNVNNSLDSRSYLYLGLASLGILVSIGFLDLLVGWITKKWALTTIVLILDCVSLFTCVVLMYRESMIS
jgi:hypothetical protein